MQKKHIAILLIFFIVISGCSIEKNKYAGENWRRYDIGRIDSHTWPLVCSATAADGCHVAWMEETLFHGFSVMLDGNKIERISGSDSSIHISANGKYVTFFSKIGKKTFAMINDKFSFELKDVKSLNIAPSFSQDNKKIACIFRDKKNNFVAVMDGVHMPPIDGFLFPPSNSMLDVPSNLNCRKRNIFFSPDGRHIAYINVQSGIKESGFKDVFSVIVDGIPGPMFKNIDIFPFKNDHIFPMTDSHLFSPDSQHLVYRGDDMLVIDQKINQLPSGTRDVIIQDTPQGMYMAFLVASPDGQFIMRDGCPGPKRKAIIFPSFSPNGKRFSYTAVDDKGCLTAFLDGKPLLQHQESACVFFSPNNERTAYFASSNKENQWFVVVDGKRWPKPICVNRKHAWLYFSPDSKHVACVETTPNSSKWYLVVDGKRVSAIRPIKEKSVRFSPDSKHILYQTEDFYGENKGMFVVVDGVKGPLVDYIVADPIFRDNGTVEYIAIRKKTLFRVIVSLTSSETWGCP